VFIGPGWGGDWRFGKATQWICTSRTAILAGNVLFLQMTVSRPSGLRESSVLVEKVRSRSGWTWIQEQCSRELREWWGARHRTKRRLRKITNRSIFLGDFCVSNETKVWGI